MSSHHTFLPLGWVEATDPKSGRKYYANPTTGETRWDAPPRVSASFAPSAPSSKPQSKPQSKSRSKSPSGSGGSSDGTGKSLGKAGNKLYTAPAVNEAINFPSQLVPVARSMLEKAGAFPDKAAASDVELNSVTPGQIADLCRIQHETIECGNKVAYTPVNPFRMSTHSHMTEKEEGRLDVRLSTLKKELKKSPK